MIVNLKIKMDILYAIIYSIIKYKFQKNGKISNIKILKDHNTKKEEI